MQTRSCIRHKTGTVLQVALQPLDETESYQDTMKCLVQLRSSVLPWVRKHQAEAKRHDLELALQYKFAMHEWQIYLQGELLPFCMLA